MTFESPNGGESQHLSPACRAYLREAFAMPSSADLASAHQNSCAFCAARAASRDHLGALIAQRPPMPAGVAAASWAEAVHGRIVEQIEDGKLGEALAGALSAPLPTPEDMDWQSTLLRSDVARRVATSSVSCSPAVWAQIRHAILSEVGLRAAVGARWRWLLGAVGLAAGLALVCLSWPHKPTPLPDIIFTDLSVMPDVEFSAVRHGVRQ